MPPKGKKNRKNDDWDADLGESIAPVNPAAAVPTADEAPAAAEKEEEAPVGGLMALMRKNKEKRKKKGLSEDWLDGETPEGQVPAAVPEPDLSAKQAEEANLEDEWALPDKKGKKGGKQQQQQQQQQQNKKQQQEEKKKDDEEVPEIRVLTKAEKERLKKEREKQRKKEQVCFTGTNFQRWLDTDVYYL